MNTTKLSRFAKEIANTSSSEKRLDPKELLISRDTPHFADAVISTMFGINSAVGSILKSQRVILDRIETIAQRMETIEKEVQSLKDQLTIKPPETSLPMNSPFALDQDLMDFINSLPPVLEHGISPDIICYETL